LVRLVGQKSSNTTTLKARSRKRPGLAKRENRFHKTKDRERPPPPWRTAAATEAWRPPAGKRPADAGHAAATASATAAAANQARRRWRRCVARNRVGGKEHTWCGGGGGRRRGRRRFGGRHAPATRGQHPTRPAGSEQVVPRLHRPLPASARPAAAWRQRWAPATAAAAVPPTPQPPPWPQRPQSHLRRLQSRPHRRQSRPRRQHARRCCRRRPSLSHAPAPARAMGTGATATAAAFPFSPPRSPHPPASTQRARRRGVPRKRLFPTGPKAPPGGRPHNGGPAPPPAHPQPRA